MSQLGRSSIREQIRDLLIDRIESGTYPPGTRLREMRLAEEFGSSQGPVREAMRELAALNLVISESHRGTYVREVSGREQRNAYEVRLELERLALRKLADCPDLDWTSVATHANATYAAAQAGDATAFAQADAAFHKSIVQLSGNEELVKAWEDLRPTLHISLALRDLGATSARLEALAVEHAELVEALARSDSERAMALLESHLTRVSAVLGTRGGEGSAN